MAIDNLCGWIALAGEGAPRSALRGSQNADWLIIGGGITGLSAAHSLAALFPDQRIVLLERQRLAQGPRRATRVLPSATNCPQPPSCSVSRALRPISGRAASAWRPVRRCASASIS